MIFFSKSKSTVLYDLKESSSQLASLTNHLATQKLHDIFAKVFPSLDESSPFNQIYQQATKHTKSTYQSLEQIVKLFQPQSHIGHAIWHNRDSKYNLDKLNTCTQLSKFLNTKQGTLICNIKKQISITSIPLLQAFFIHIFTALLNQKDHEMPIKEWKERFNNDEFYYYMVRNPLLHIIREWIEYSRNKPLIFDRIIAILQLLLYKYPIYSIKTVDNYANRPSQLYAVYMLFQWRINPLAWQFLTLLGEYLLYCHKNFNTLFGIWLKLHISILKRFSAYEKEYRKLISSVFISKTWQISMLGERIEKELLYDNDSDYLARLSLPILKILQRDIWSMTAPFVANIKLIILLYKNIHIEHNLSQSFCTKMIQKMIKNEKSADIKKIIKKTFYVELELNPNQVHQYHHSESAAEISGMNHLSGSGSGRSGLSSSFGRSRRSMTRNIRQVNGWQQPLRTGQNSLLFKWAKSLSHSIDKLKKLPPSSQSQPPKTNLRFLSSYKFLALSILIVMALFNLLK